jgi:rhamnose utilization protein RhaD (predicted bifunctional aldolase and dehydrogenase)/NAD(P)-dependent dehydrogenase (short-subunit alcohol dehydrogenase family)
MKNNWSNLEAKKYIKKYQGLGFSEDVALRVYTTHLLGKNKKLVLHGGGNTSVKTTENDIDGKKYNVLRVKGSGWDMGDIEPDGLPAVKIEPLLSMLHKKNLSDEDMVSFQKRNLLNINSPNPSVETFLHAFLPHKYVDHTHADAILNITNRPDGIRLCKKIFGNKVGFVPYIMPGFLLAKKVYDIYRKNINVNTLILLNHGIFTFSNDAKEAYKLMIDNVTIAEKTINKSNKKKIKQLKNPSLKLNASDIAPVIRGLLTDDKSNKTFIINHRINDDIKTFMNGVDVNRYSQVGTITPDHVIRIKPYPLIIDLKDNANIDSFHKIAKTSIKKYVEKYKSYYKKYSKGKNLTMLDPYPRIIYVKGMGMFSVGDNYKSSIIAGDLAETNARVIASIEKSTKYKTISEKDIFDIEYWSLEQAKLNKKNKLLEGKIVAITGSTGTIGYETYKIFTEQGAEVVLIDCNKEQISKIQSSIPNLCLYADVTKRENVQKVFKVICERFGGIDILISNAGSVSDGPIADVSDKSLKQSFDDNFFSHQICASEAVKVMLKQENKGCLLFNISKQSVNPGKNFGPYGLPKTALLGLCKQYALDYGKYGIRANGINADRIKSGLLNDNIIKTRAKARNVTTNKYMKGNLLTKEVTAKDVALAFLHLAISEKTTGAVLTVDGGNIAASMR